MSAFPANIWKHNNLLYNQSLARNINSPYRLLCIYVMSLLRIWRFIKTTTPADDLLYSRHLLLENELILWGEIISWSDSTYIILPYLGWRKSQVIKTIRFFLESGFHCVTIRVIHGSRNFINFCWDFHWYVHLIPHVITNSFLAGEGRRDRLLRYTEMEK